MAQIVGRVCTLLDAVRSSVAMPADLGDTRWRGAFLVRRAVAEELFTVPGGLRAAWLREALVLSEQHALRKWKAQLFCEIWL